MRMSAIKHIRNAIFGLSQAEFATIADVSQATISRWEAGEFEPGLNEMRRIRNEAIARGLDWDDGAFFVEPSPTAASVEAAE